MTRRILCALGVHRTVRVYIGTAECLECHRTWNVDMTKAEAQRLAQFIATLTRTPGDKP